MRKLAHIEKILELNPIESKDNVLDCRVLGWQTLVSKKDNFKVGDLVCLIEIDSVMPQIPEYEFLAKYDYKVKTQKYFKGTFVSQGLILPLSKLPQQEYSIGDDVTDLLQIKKYLSKSDKEELDNQTKIKHWTKNYKITKWLWKHAWFRNIIKPVKLKYWPAHIRHTDEERLVNIPYVLEHFKDKQVYITEKIDYASGSFTGTYKYLFNGILRKLFPFKNYNFIVCSRNWVVYDKTTLWWKVAIKYNIENILKENPTLTIQGECGDTKTQSNKYGITEPTMWVFNIIDHEKNYQYNWYEMNRFCEKYNLKTVPLLLSGAKLSDWKDVNDFVEYSKQMKSLVNPNVEREGVVIRCIENGHKVLSFKVINPNFLLKYSE